MEYSSVLLLTFIAYLMGAFPLGVLIGKIFYGIDLREHGNGSSSWRNAYNVISASTGIIIAILEVLQGCIAPALAIWGNIHWHLFSDYEYPFLMLSFGLTGILGQNFSVFTNFKGTRDVTTALGVFLILNPLATISCLAIAILIYVLSHYVHVGYVIAMLCFPIFIKLFPTNHDYVPQTLWFFVGILSSALFYFHRSEMLTFMDTSLSSIYHLPHNLWERIKSKRKI
jgi:glycerol-3-phosphate acyltransferase PlsY